jgi:hypothetical protein
VIISDKSHFVLLSPWKTASSTSHLRLVAYNESPYSRFFYFNPFLQRVLHQHITYPEFAALPEGRKGISPGRSSAIRMIESIRGFYSCSGISSSIRRRSFRPLG